MIFTLPQRFKPLKERAFADYWYAPSSDPQGLAIGLWDDASLRPESWRRTTSYLPRCIHRAAAQSVRCSVLRRVTTTREKKRSFDITAINPGQGGISYTSRNQNGTDDFAIRFVHTKDLNGKTREARSSRSSFGGCGEWIKLKIQNASGVIRIQFRPFLGLGGSRSGSIARFNKIDLRASTSLGVHPSLVAYDVRHADGKMNIGYNGAETINVAMG